MSALLDLDLDPDLVRTLPAHVQQPVPAEHIDENGHMNIRHYFELGAWAAWARLRELGMGEDYIETRGMSFFTVEHRVRYLGELRLGERYSVRATLTEHTAKAAHGVSLVVDEERDRLACTLEVVYVHVDMATRRSTPIPDDLAAALDAEAAAYPWAAAVATGLSLHR